MSFLKLVESVVISIWRHCDRGQRRLEGMLDYRDGSAETTGVPCAWDEALEGRRRFYALDPWGNRLEFTE